jgi:ABC-2 type transport system ATP-binding protein
MILKLSGTSFSYAAHAENAAPALQKCDLEIDTTRVTVTLGHNGAGKSTLIRLLTGQLLGYTGEYAIDGKVQDPARGELLALNRFGYAPDHPVLEPHLTGLEMICMAGSFRGWTEPQTLAGLEIYREMFELEDWLENKTCSAYSKGMAKKIALVIGLIGDLAYTFLDEPFDGLDPISIHNLKKHLRARKEKGIGTLLSSHMLDAAEKVVDDVILMKSGLVAFAGSYPDLLAGHPQAKGGLEEIYFTLFGT